MKKIYLFVLILFLSLTIKKVEAQCTLNVVSSKGYTVSITPIITSITVTPNGCGGSFCMCGYVYKYVLSYNITFSGSNIPSNLWTLQGNVVDVNGSSFFNLPNNGGSGTVSSANVSTILTNCATVTSSYFNPCIFIIIEGLGISKQTISCTCIATPIELLYFKGSIKNSSVFLEWSTTTELNNDYFIIERSSDLINWISIAKIKGGGSSNDINNYNYLDTNSFNGNYYKIKQIDYNGNFTYTDIIYVNNIKSVKTIVYPNPIINSMVDIKIISTSLSPVNITVYDILGHVVNNIVVNKNDAELNYNLTLPLNKELFIIIIMQDNVIIGEHKIVSK